MHALDQTRWPCRWSHWVEEGRASRHIGRLGARASRGSSLHSVRRDETRSERECEITYIIRVQVRVEYIRGLSWRQRVSGAHSGEEWGRTVRGNYEGG